ncbi:MAG: metal-dependent transcriptional regulator [Rubrobacter sp.]|nr:metal-dependent transcriptional regulator [Rubrobacter sp.]
MNDPIASQHTSSSVEDYVKAIWELAGANAASTKEISKRLRLSGASVTNMLGRLKEMGLVNYERYHGASLTEEGCAQALRIVRRHRLIESFLLEQLGYSWGEVHEEAERLEHAVSDEFTERLAEFLGHPARDPHGDPIPRADGTLERDESFRLDEAAAGQLVRISRVNPENPSMLNYLGKHGLVPGQTLTVNEIRTVDGVVTIEDEDGKSYSLGRPLAASLFVQGVVEPTNTYPVEPTTTYPS